MNTFARIIASGVFTSLLLVSPAAFADRPSMSEAGSATPDRGTPVQGSSDDWRPKAGPDISATDTSAADSRAEASAEEAAEAELAAKLEAVDKARTVTRVVETTGAPIEVRKGETLGVQLLDFPRRGMSMDKVKNELGKPVQVFPAIGEPPITSWKYNDRMVYFERSLVIHAVATQ